MSAYPTGASRLIVILAHPADHLRAPELYTPHFERSGLDWHMVPFDVSAAHLAEAVRTLTRSKSVAGFNITIPHKRAVCALCDELGPAAGFIGVVNTIRIEADGRLVGDTFDGTGFLNAARHNRLIDDNRRCVVIGAGGAGRAICHALALDGVGKLAISDTNHAAAETLAQALAAHFTHIDIRLGAEMGDAGLVVNATPLGLHPGDPLPFPVDDLPSDCAVFDIIAARRTDLVEAAAARGLRVLDGVPMVMHQLDAQTAFWRVGRG